MDSDIKNEIEELKKWQEKSHKLLEDHMAEAKNFFDRLNSLDERYNTLEKQYKTNGVEWKKAMMSIEKLSTHMIARDKKLDEVFQPYRDAKGIARAIKWVGGIVLTLSSVWAVIKLIITRL